jgi:alpha-D-ribose 1-methylphosphonate 5-triphosphate synthase subunit PhnG
MKDHPNPSRRRWMSILARADAGQIQALLAAAGAPVRHTVIRGPEGGLVMVRGRAGGGGAAFNLGEMTVTRCTVRSEAGRIGHAYIAGRDGKRAELAALADALLQDPDWAERLQAGVIDRLEHDQTQARAVRAAKAEATRVQFFAMETTRS